MSRADDEKVTVVVSGEDGDMIRSAAESEGMTLADFALESMRRHAGDVLADRRLFRVSDDAWKELDAMLDGPPADRPRLRDLLDDEHGQD